MAESPVLDRVNSAILGRLRLRPIFVVGSNKVGKSLLCTALSEHPRILCSSREAPFLGFLGDLVDTIENCNADVPREWAAHDPHTYVWRTIRVAPTQFRASLRRLGFESVFGSHYGIRALSRKLRSSPRSFLSLRSGRWCAQTFPSPSQYRGLMLLYEHARFIYIVRNGADAIQARIDSVLARSGFRVPFEAACQHWAAGVKRYSYLSSAEAALQIRFEDLKEEPDRVIATVLEFVGLARQRGPAAAANGALWRVPGSARPLAVVEADSANPASEGWSNAERRMFARICGEAMETLGYSSPLPV